jgi:hypothetical protein
VTAVRAVVSRLRADSRNPDLRIMVGGRMFMDQPGLADETGADGSALDANDALRLANRLIQPINHGMDRIDASHARWPLRHGAGTASPG